MKFMAAARRGGMVAMWLLGGAVAAAQPPEGVVRAERSSPSGPLRVTDYPERGLRCLEFPPGRGMPSCMRRGRPAELVFPYLRSMFAALALHPNPRRVLVVGLGGGSLTRAMQRAFPHLRQTIVEIDPEVVHVCREFFGLVPTLVTQVEVADARTFLFRSREVFDVIFLDVYGPAATPRHLTTLEFFRLVRARLRPGGVVACHLWGPQVNELYFRQLATLAGSFPTVYLLRAGTRAGSPNETSSYVVIAVLGAGGTVREWMARAAQLQASGKVDFDLAGVVRHEVEELSAGELAAEPLRDQERP